MSQKTTWPDGRGTLFASTTGMVTSSPNGAPVIVVAVTVKVVPVLVNWMQSVGVAHGPV